MCPTFEVAITVSLLIQLEIFVSQESSHGYCTAVFDDDDDGDW